MDGTSQVAPGVLSSFLTSLTICVPLAFLSGKIGSVLKVIPVVLIPLVASIAFGLVATTAMVLFLIPVLYMIFEDWGWARRHEEDELGHSV